MKKMIMAPTKLVVAMVVLSIASLAADLMAPNILFLIAITLSLTSAWILIKGYEVDLMEAKEMTEEEIEEIMAEMRGYFNDITGDKDE